MRVSNLYLCISNIYIHSYEFAAAACEAVSLVSSFHGVAVVAVAAAANDSELGLSVNFTMGSTSPSRET